MVLISIEFLCSSTESGVGPSNNGVEPNSAATIPTSQETEHIGKQVGKTATITTALANAGHILEGADAELVLNPLRLAFETKNVKVLELALDCLHVCPFYLGCYISSKDLLYT